MIEHPEVLQLLEDIDPDEVGETVVILRCDSAYHGKIIGSRWYVNPCRGKKCRIPGEHTFHAWDIRTGELRPFLHEPSGADLKGT